MASPSTLHTRNFHVVGIILFLISIVLLALNIISLFLPTIGTSQPSNADAIAGYDYRLLEVETAVDLYKQMQDGSSPSEEKANKLLKLVFESYVHTDQAYKIKPWDNWYLWLRSFINSRFSDSQNPMFLWKKGGGFCHQAAIIYTGLAKQLGFEGRLVWLEGHVISQILIPELGWRAVDPDTGIYWNYSIDDLATAVNQQQMASVFKNYGYSAAHGERLAQIYLSTGDNYKTFLPYLPGMHESEKLSLYLQWLIPLSLLLLSLFWLR